jgi:CRISPR-associated protein Cst1
MTVLAGRTSPDELGPQDYQRVADRLFKELYTSYDAASGYYAQGPFKSYLVWLFPNSVWTTPSISKEPEKASASLQSYAQQTLYAFALPVDPQAEACSFCGRPAVDRALRTKVPLLTGGFPNFSPQGVTGVPICGRCLLAVHALPVGGMVTKGRRLMIAHSSDPALLLRFAHYAVALNQDAIQNAGQAGWPQTPYPRTRLVELLRETERRTPGALRDAVMLYQFTNDNRGADLEMYCLTSPVIAFLREVENPYDRERHDAWRRAVQAAWKADKDSVIDESASRNVLYEDLYTLPERAVDFLKRYILPARNWSLTACFVRKVMGMDDDQLKLLYALGSRFADYAREKRGFYYEFVRESNYSTWRRRLLSAADTWSRQGKVLITAEEFVQAFVATRHADEYFNWKLARDIVALRMMEELAQAGLIAPDEEELIPAEQEGAEKTDED